MDGKAIDDLRYRMNYYCKLQQAKCTKKGRARAQAMKVALHMLKAVEQEYIEMSVEEYVKETVSCEKKILVDEDGKCISDVKTEEEIKECLRCPRLSYISDVVSTRNANLISYVCANLNKRFSETRKEFCEFCVNYNAKYNCCSNELDEDGN